MTLKPEPTPGDTRWFIHDRFGLFINWGIYSVVARYEWVKSYGKMTDTEYQKYFEHFDPADCRFTQKGNRIYLHIFSWPFKHIYFDNMADKIEYAQLLNDGSEIKKDDLNTLTLVLPIQKPDVIVPVVELFLK